MAQMDPIVLADSLCEVLLEREPAQARGALQPLLSAAGGSLARALDEVARQGLMGRLVQAAGEGDDLFAYLIAGAQRPAVLWHMAAALLEDGEAPRLERVILRAHEQGLLGGLFQSLIGAGRYEALRRALTADGCCDSPGLRALAAARPTYDHQALNQAAWQAISAYRQSGPTAAHVHDVLIVPGYTPLDAREPLHIAHNEVAQRRLRLAADDLHAGVAPFVIVTGGSVYPPGTPHNEALMMREHLLDLHIAAERILVEPYARHTTTNLRNAGRFMRQGGLTSGLIVTGFDRAVFSQAFYLAHAGLSTFHARCQEELGYIVGDLRREDDHHIAFSPAPEVDAPNYADPWDV
jgi:hypothetical protein